MRCRKSDKASGKHTHQLSGGANASTTNQDENLRQVSCNPTYALFVGGIYIFFNQRFSAWPFFPTTRRLASSSALRVRFARSRDVCRCRFLLARLPDFLPFCLLGPTLALAVEAEGVLSSPCCPALSFCRVSRLTVTAAVASCCEPQHTITNQRNKSFQILQRGVIR